MSGHLISPRREVRQTVQELRRHSGLFSFRNDVPPAQSVRRNSISPELGVRPGGIVECLVARQGAGALTSAMQIMAQSSAGQWILGGCGSRSGSSTYLPYRGGALIRAERCFSVPRLERKRAGRSRNA